MTIRAPSRVRGLVMIDSAGLTPSTMFTRAACWIQGREAVRRATGIAFARHYLRARNERVDALSKTETFVAMKLEIDNWRWKDVPFYLRVGKAMPERRTEIVVQYRRPPFALFRNTAICR